VNSKGLLFVGACICYYILVADDCLLLDYTLFRLPLFLFPGKILGDVGRFDRDEIDDGRIRVRLSQLLRVSREGPTPSSKFAAVAVVFRAMEFSSSIEEDSVWLSSISFPFPSL